jgi:Tfp pilus assembly protein PilP
LTAERQADVTRRAITLATALTAVLTSAPAFAQSPAPAAPASATQGPAPASGKEPVTASPAAQPAPDAQPPENPGFAYRPEGRRDPFVSLMRRGTDTARDTGVRPPGLPGIGTGELTLRGIMQSRDGYVALVQGVDSKTYLVRPGDKLYDGSVRSITATTMVILQQVNDPLSLDKQREVRKVLRQTEEVK